LENFWWQKHPCLEKMFLINEALIVATEMIELMVNPL
jgi:hypothetical protein